MRSSINTFIRWHSKLHWPLHCRFHRMCTTLYKTHLFPLPKHCIWYIVTAPVLRLQDSATSITIRVRSKTTGHSRRLPPNQAQQFHLVIKQYWCKIQQADLFLTALIAVVTDVRLWHKTSCFHLSHQLCIAAVLHIWPYHFKPSTFHPSITFFHTYL